jgi:hypothetical protein
MVDITVLSSFLIFCSLIRLKILNLWQQNIFPSNFRMKKSKLWKFTGDKNVIEFFPSHRDVHQSMTTKLNYQFIVLIAVWDQTNLCNVKLRVEIVQHSVNSYHFQPLGCKGRTSVHSLWRTSEVWQTQPKL